MGQIAVLTGRYEIVHPGHIKTIRREAPKYDKFYVFIVGNAGGVWPPEWSKELIDFCCADLGNVETVIHPCHFGYATEVDIESIRYTGFHVFLSVNPDVTKRVRGLGVNVREIPPTPGYASRNVKGAILQQAIEIWQRSLGGT